MSTNAPQPQTTRAAQTTGRRTQPQPPTDPENGITIRPDIAELLHAGLSDDAISKQLHCADITVSKTRAALGLPKAKSGVRPAPTPEAAFHTRTREAEGGHLIWTGHVSHGTPMLRHGGRLLSAYRIAWRIRTGREPVGHVRLMCGVPGCVAPACVDDRPTRQRDRNALAGVLAATPTST